MTKYCFFNDKNVNICLAFKLIEKRVGGGVMNMVPLFIKTVLMCNHCNGLEILILSSIKMQSGQVKAVNAKNRDPNRLDTAKNDPVDSVTRSGVNECV